MTRYKVLFLAFAWVLLSIAIASLLIPINPTMPRSGLDPSWVLAINEAAARGRIFGSDVIFTYGPLAAVSTRQYYPGAYAVAVTAGTMITLGYLEALRIMLARKSWLWPVAAAILIAALCTTNALLAAYPLLVGIVFLSEQHLAPSHTAGTLSKRLTLWIPVGLLFLIKGSFWPLSALSIVLCCLFNFTKGRHIASLAIILAPLCATLSGWLVVGQPLNALPSYVLGMLPLITGYSEAMSLQGNPLEILMYLLVSGCILILMLMSSKGREIGPRLLLLALTGAYIILLFKSAFVRHDQHALLGASALVTLLVSVSGSLKTRHALIAVVVSFGGSLYIKSHYVQRPWLNLGNTAIHRFLSPAEGLASLVSQEHRLKDRYETAMASVARQHPLPATGGSTDIYPFDLAYIIASDNQWRPRPVIQSYSAYTKSLATKNRDHLTSESAPENIFFRIRPIDGRFPSLDDGASWPILLNHYHADYKAGDFLKITARKNLDASNSISVRGKGRYKLGELVVLQENMWPIFVNLYIERSTLGHVVNLIYKLPELYILTRTADEKVHVHRFIPGSAEAGFLLSPQVNNTAEFLQLYFGGAGLESKRVTSFAIFSKRWPGYWKNNYEVTFNELKLPTSADRTPDNLP